MQHKKKARVIAGGTDLLPKMQNREAVPEHVIGVNAVSGLGYVGYDKVGRLRIDALATLAAVMSSSAVQTNWSRP